MRPQPIEPVHYDAILRNNARYVHWLWPLDTDGLSRLLGQADYARQLHDGEAVLIAYDGHGPYRHANVDWLAERLDDFFYIDRVIVGALAQGKGAGRRLYDDVAQFARARGHGNLACEVNLDPDNPVSHAFHLALGFRAIGDATVTGKAPARYYMRDLSDVAP